MILIYKLDLYFLKMYICTKNELSIGQGAVRTLLIDRQADRQTDATERITTAVSRVVKMLTEGIDL